MNELLTAVAASLVFAAIIFVVKELRNRWDRRLVHSWLELNTVDKPDESHVATIAIAKGAGISEERVRLACLSEARIHRAPGEHDSWSVWDEVPQRPQGREIGDAIAEVADQ